MVQFETKLCLTEKNTKMISQTAQGNHIELSLCSVSFTFWANQVGKSQIASLVADVFSNTAVAENKVLLFELQSPITLGFVNERDRLVLLIKWKYHK